jgi:hypothetical protein
MSSYKMAAIALIVAGALGLLVNIPVWVGMGTVLAGGVMLAASKRTS